AAHDLTQQVRFLGTYKDTAELYPVMDGFLFPSLFEGLPVVLVEAQAAGLPCLVSNRVSQETAVTDLVQFLPLEAGAPAWAEKAISLPTLQRKDFAELVAKAGFDAATQAYRLQQFYLQKAAEFPREVRG
ncbi:MAG: glycosyltransferase, partial [Ruthenibacterium sp.]